ncbi:MAG TPA: hypothetical protein VGH54_26520 [Mycobacterium sp.]|jgi:hypothetical protein|uniref:hypothetical protein n=1 Tax=Mycobacterium sp. TaxID=1785 RepID=UPI002F4017E5
MATGLAVFAVILSIGTLIALLFVLALVITLTRPDRKPALPAITDAEASCDMCIHCGAVGLPGLFGNGADHAIGCPTITDVWPVGPLDVQDGLTCEMCSHVLQLGETYTTARDIRCIGCTVIEATP